jgi:hypothetical protein
MDQPPATDWQRVLTALVSLTVPRSDDIANSPAKIGVLLEVIDLFAKLEPVVRERAISLAMQKTKIPGWSAVHKDPNSYVSSTDIADLAMRCPFGKLPAFVSLLVTQLGNVSEARYRALCDAAGIEPVEEKIKQSGVTLFLRRSNHDSN